MAIVAPATLKGYFNTGDVPTESQFADFVDTATKYDSAKYANITDSNSFYTGTNVDAALDEAAGNIQAINNTIANNVPITYGVNPLYYTKNPGTTGCPRFETIGNTTSSNSATYWVANVGKMVYLTGTVSANLGAGSAIAININPVQSNIPQINISTLPIVQLAFGDYAKANFGNFGVATIGANLISCYDKTGAALNATAAGTQTAYYQVTYLMK